MKDALKALLKRIGFSDAHIEAMDKDPEKFDADGIFAEVDTNIRTALSADKEFTKTIHSQATAEVLSSKEGYITRLLEGKVTPEELEALPKRDRFNKLIDLTFNKLSAKDKTPDEKDKEIARLNAEAQTFTTKLSEKDKEIEKAGQKATEVEHRFYRRNALESAMLTGDRKTVLDAKKTAGLLEQDILSEYDLKWDPASNKAILRQKGTDNPVFDPADRSKPLELDAVVTRIGEANGYFVKSNAGQGGSNGGGNGAIRTEPAAPGKNEPPGIAAARQRETARSKGGK